MSTKVYAVFPGVGKTHFAETAGPRVSDIDSRHFAKDQFPENYIAHIKTKLNSADIVLVTCHKVVLEALMKEGIPFKLVYPNRDLRQEYLERFKARGDKKQFIESLEAKWNTLLDELERVRSAPHIVVKSGEYLRDVLIPR